MNTLKTKNNNKECIYARTLHDANIKDNFKNHYYMTNQGVDYYKVYNDMFVSFDKQ